MTGQSGFLRALVVEGVGRAQKARRRLPGAERPFQVDQSESGLARFWFLERVEQWSIWAPRQPAEQQQRQRGRARTSVAPPEEAIDHSGRG
jgi:hypothetical protein